MKWLLENILTELIFGVLLFGVIIAWARKRIVDFFRARWLLKHILLVHNQPTRTWQKGLCLADRFMQLYESAVPLRSSNDLVAPYAIWRNMVVDAKILKFHGLVTTADIRGVLHAEAVRNGMTRMIYTALKKREEKEKKATEYFMQSKTLRDVS